MLRSAGGSGRSARPCAKAWSETLQTTDLDRSPAFVVQDTGAFTEHLGGADPGTGASQ